MNKLPKYIISAAVVLVVLSLLLLKWTYWEPSDFRKGTLVYRMVVPTEVKAFPAWSEIALPDYSVRGADGLKPSAVTMRYHSTLTLEQLADTATKITFTCQKNPAGGTFCEKKINAAQVIQIIFDKGANATTSKVEVIFSGY